MGEIGAYPRSAPDYPWAAPDFPRGQRANCSLVRLQQTMGSQFPCILRVGISSNSSAVFLFEKSPLHGFVYPRLDIDVVLDPDILRIAGIEEIYDRVQKKLAKGKQLAAKDTAV